jgi:TonB family protein
VRVVWGAKFHWVPREGMEMVEGSSSPHYCSPFDYPAQALENKAEGTTVLTFRITERGTLDRIFVAESSGNRDLDEASKSCASTWIYEPEVKGSSVAPTLWSAQITWKNGRSIAAELGNGDEPP